MWTKLVEHLKVFRSSSHFSFLLLSEASRKERAERTKNLFPTRQSPVSGTKGVGDFCFAQQFFAGRGTRGKREERKGEKIIRPGMMFATCKILIFWVESKLMHSYCNMQYIESFRSSIVELNWWYHSRCLLLCRFRQMESTWLEAWTAICTHS